MTNIIVYQALKVTEIRFYSFSQEAIAICFQQAAMHSSHFLWARDHNFFETRTFPVSPDENMVLNVGELSFTTLMLSWECCRLINTLRLLSAQQAYLPGNV